MNALHDLEPMSVAHIADVSGHGIIMNPSMKSQWRGARFAGYAFTVMTPPGDNASLQEALDLVEPGDVIVVDGQNHLDRALWGAIMSKAALNRGVKGIVVAGAVRDVEETEDLGFPVFALGRSPSTPYNKVKGSVDQPIRCGDVDVNPGDIVYADGDGVAVVAQSLHEETLRRAADRHNLEALILEGLGRGEKLSELLPILRQTRPPNT